MPITVPGRLPNVIIYMENYMVHPFPSENLNYFRLIYILMFSYALIQSILFDFPP